MTPHLKLLGSVVHDAIVQHSIHVAVLALLFATHTSWLDSSSRRQLPGPIYHLAGWPSFGRLAAYEAEAGWVRGQPLPPSAPAFMDWEPRGCGAGQGRGPGPALWTLAARHQDAACCLLITVHLGRQRAMALVRLARPL